MPESPYAPDFFPSSWRKGELLDVRRFNDGTFTVASCWDQAEDPAKITFHTTEACQDFVSWWYAPEPGR